MNRPPTLLQWLLLSRPLSLAAEQEHGRAGGAWNDLRRNMVADTVTTQMPATITQRNQSDDHGEAEAESDSDEAQAAYDEVLAARAGREASSCRPRAVTLVSDSDLRGNG